MKHCLRLVQNPRFVSLLFYILDIVNHLDINYNILHSLFFWIILNTSGCFDFTLSRFLFIYIKSICLFIFFFKKLITFSVLQNHVKLSYLNVRFALYEIVYAWYIHHIDWTPEALENEGLKSQILCKICMEKKVSIAFLPCSHLVCCEDCAPAMRTCPFCRKFIKGTVKTFLV